MEIARFADFGKNSLLGAELAGAPILLVRQGGEVRAFSGLCPHAGAKLSEGVLDGDRVICPWHKAAFCTRTGRLLDPPAVDDLIAYPVELRGEAIHLGSPPSAPQPAMPPGEDRRVFVVIGAGAAGTAGARELRVAGFPGRIVLIDQEEALPYDRTLLSKYELSGESGGEKSPLHDSSFYRRLRIERRIGQVVALDPAAKIVTFADDATLAYDAALVSTGGRPVAPPFPGAAEAGVFLLRNRGDLAAILAQAGTARTAAVIGASFISMEVAAALRERGLDVTVVAKENAPYEKQLGARVGAVFQRLHERHGVGFCFGAKIERLESGATKTIVLAGGERIEAELIVAGLGVRPATGFLHGLTRETDQALIVGPDLRLADGLYAAGDIAAFPARGDGALIRVEHWRVAQQQGRVAARSMLGEAARYDAVPVFWTIQYMKRLDYVGHAAGDDELVIRGDLEKPEFIAYYLRGGKVAAAAGFDRDEDMAAIIALMERQRDWTLDALHPFGGSPIEVLRHQSALLDLGQGIGRAGGFR